MRKSVLEKLREAKAVKGETRTLDLNGLMHLLLGGEPRPTQREFILDGARVKGYMGAAGVAKTSTLCAAGFLRALLQPGSRGLVARLDYNKLQDTTMGRMEDMLHRLPPGVLLERDKAPPAKWWIQPVAQRHPVTGELDDTPSQITFMGLKEALGSYEFDWAILDEADEIPEQAVRLVNSRMRNKLYAGKDVAAPYSVMLAFNPPDKSHWLYPACTGRNHKEEPAEDGGWIKLFKPVKGENDVNLPRDYYEQLTKSLTADQRRRLVDGEWGATFEGKAVYPQFHPELHVRDCATWWRPHMPLFRGWDFGFQHPFCVWATMDGKGRLLVLREHMGEAVEAKAFARHCKALTQQWFPGAEDVRDFGDPAVNQQKDVGRTLVDFAEEGIVVYYRKSEIDRGLNVLRRQMEQLIDGRPAFIIDPSCQILIGALRGGYHYKDPPRTSVSGKYLPEKDGYWDHGADALRYLAINLLDGGISKTGKLPTSLAYSSAADPT